MTYQPCLIKKTLSRQVALFYKQTIIDSSTKTDRTITSIRHSGMDFDDQTSIDSQITFDTQFSHIIMDKFDYYGELCRLKPYLSQLAPERQTQLQGWVSFELQRGADITTIVQRLEPYIIPPQIEQSPPLVVPYALEEEQNEESQEEAERQQEEHDVVSPDVNAIEVTANLSHEVLKLRIEHQNRKEKFRTMRKRLREIRTNFRQQMLAIRDNQWQYIQKIGRSQGFIKLMKKWEQEVGIERFHEARKHNQETERQL